MIKPILFLAASLGFVHATAFAQPQQQPTAPQQQVRTVDPNEVVCEKQEVIGSRIAVKRICRTRAEWAVLREQDRMEINKVQVQRGSCEGCP